MGNAGAMRMSRADSALLTRAGEDHLGIGTHERDGDSGTPERVEDAPEGRPPGAEDGEGGGEKPRSSSLDVERVLLGLGVVTVLLKVATKKNLRERGEGHNGASPAPAGAHRGGSDRGQRCQASPRRQHRGVLNTGTKSPPARQPCARHGRAQRARATPTSSGPS
eukprot:scaffold14246_cov105-Isochrysis_galbana.AAC.13